MRVTFIPDLGHEGSDCGIFQHGVGKFIQPGPPFEQGHRNPKGQAELGLNHVRGTILALGRLADDRNAGFEHPDSDPLDLLGLQVVFPCEAEHRVNRSLGIATAGVRFDRGLQNLKILAQSLTDFARLGSHAIGFEKAVPPFEDRVRTAEALFCQQGSMNAAERGPARMKAFCPGPLGQKLHRPGRLTAGNAESGQQLGFTQAQQLGRAGRSAKGAAGRRGMEPATIVLGRFEGHSQPGRDLKADHTRGEKILAARADLFCHG